MTKNQIEYMKLQEDIRSHVAQEAETGRANRAKEQETKRANLANEELTRQRDVKTLGLRESELTEQNRANLAREEANLRAIAETERSNRAKEEENFRSNMAQEQERYRSNVASEELRQLELDELIRTHQANEEIGRLQAYAAQTSAGAAARNAEIRAQELQSLDNYRAQQLEVEEAKYQENARHNKAQEVLKQYEIEQGERELANQRDRTAISQQEADIRASIARTQADRLRLDTYYAGLNYDLDVGKLEDRERQTRYGLYGDVISAASRILS